MVERLPAEQREAIRARVLEPRDYARLPKPRSAGSETRGPSPAADGGADAWIRRRSSGSRAFHARASATMSGAASTGPTLPAGALAVAGSSPYLQLGQVAVSASQAAARLTHIVCDTRRRRVTRRSGRAAMGVATATRGAGTGTGGARLRFSESSLLPGGAALWRRSRDRDAIRPFAPAPVRARRLCIELLGTSRPRGARRAPALRKDRLCDPSREVHDKHVLERVALRSNQAT